MRNPRSAAAHEKSQQWTTNFDTFAKLTAMHVKHIPSTPRICEQRTFSKKTAPSVESGSKLPYVTTTRAHTLSRKLQAHTHYQIALLSSLFLSIILLSKQISDSYKRRFCEICDVCFESTIIINHQKFYSKMWSRPTGIWPPWARFPLPTTGGRGMFRKLDIKFALTSYRIQ